ncbi:thioesterase family protein [Streptomyces inhibens]|uniref:thioesterase family protein n=1 Tax=Streptomyces inhibens TaxID=2293571 RepID=UPI00402A9AC9
MGDLQSDTEVTGGDGKWVAKVSNDWRLWSPNGGYLATIALRAAGREAPGMRPASLECHFLNSPEPGEVELTTVSLRRSGRAHSIRVSMHQDRRPVLEAIVWAVRPDLNGLPFRTVAPPDGIPHPESLEPMERLLPPERQSRRPFWQHLEERLVQPAGHLRWPEVPGETPERLSWLRYRPEPCFTDPFVDAGRAVIAIDVFIFAAAVFVLRKDQLTHIAPTLSLSVAFHRLRPAAEWLLLHIKDTFVGDGLVGGRGLVWSPDGTLIASGGAQQLCRAAG